MKKNHMPYIKKMTLSLIITLTMACLLASCCDSQTTGTAITSASKGTLRLATTTSTKDSGLLAEILPGFEMKTGWKVEVISVGSGEAMKLGENGEVDILLVHSPAAEKDFVESGHADTAGRLDVMYNDFVVVGAKADPAGVKAAAASGAIEAFKTIAGKKSTFISRGDQSGTHAKELSLWKTAGIDPKGDWYVVSGSGMGAVITMTDEKQAYTSADRATWLSFSAKTDLEIVSEKDPSGILNNQYGVICVNPGKNASIQHDGAVEFRNWITSPEAQELIGAFGAARFGAPLFTPNARQQ
jgi:tungstate transport system substrate-binding protein